MKPLPPIFLKIVGQEGTKTTEEIIAYLNSKGETNAKKLDNKRTKEDLQHHG
jgi:hypothetical protein